MDDKDGLEIGTLAFAGLAFVISLLAYRRDAPRVQVELTWEMFELRGSVPIEQQTPVVAVTLSNAGRRPIYLSHVSFETGAGRIGMLNESVPGVILDEGHQPKLYTTSQAEVLEGMRLPWWKIRVRVSSVGGKLYYSDWPTKAPNWAEGNAIPAVWLAHNTIRNWMRGIRYRYI